MMQTPSYTMLEMNRDARAAALGATRQMIADDSFAALTALLVTTGAIPAVMMAATLDSLADQLIAKARGEMEADRLLFPTELFDAARSLAARAAAIRSGSASSCAAPGR